MYKTQVKVIDEAGVGVANLVIVLYDLDPLHQEPKPRADLHGFWSQQQGRRLGSALTDNDGIAMLEFSEQQGLQQDDPAAQPDLVLFVLAPETTLPNPNGLPLSSSVEEQVLHYSHIPRVDAGRTESYLIRLSGPQLEKAGLTARGRGDRQKSVLSNLEQTQSLRRSVAQWMDAQLALKAQQAVKSINVVPLVVQNYRTP